MEGNIILYLSNLICLISQGDKFALAANYDNRTDLCHT